VLEHAVLVNAALVREGVAADDGLVVLDRERGRRRHQLGGAVEHPGVDADLVGHHVAARLDGHHDLFQRGVAGPLADAVDGAFDLPAAGADARQRVGHRHAEIVVAVDGEDRLLRARHLLHDVAEHLEIFLGGGVAHGVREVDGGGAGLERGLHAAAEIIDLGAGGVLGRPLHVLHPVARARDLEVHHLQHLFRRFHQLVLAVHGRGGDERMDTRALRVLDGLAGAVDVELARPGEPAHHRPLEPPGDLRHGLEIAFRGDGKARLDDVDAHLVEEVGDLELLLECHGGARALLAVAQGGIEYEDAVGVGALRRRFGLLGHCCGPYLPPGSLSRHLAIDGFEISIP
jgi:hypothetical protein